MRQPILHRIAAFTLLAILIAGSATAEPVPGPRQWHFKVLLDGKPIGTHDFAVTQDGQVHTTAHFKVTVALIPFYRYEHEDSESWSNGCLARIEAHTNDNGKQLEVRGQVADGRFALTSPKAARALGDCVHTFAYWDRAALSVSRLLNSQTGEYTPVELQHRGTEHIRINNRDSEAEHDSLKTDKFAIELWYSKSGEWLALQTLTEGGRTLRYEALTAG